MVVYESFDCTFMSFVIQTRKLTKSAINKTHYELIITQVRSRSCLLLSVLSYLNYPSVSSKDLIFDVLKRKEIKRMTSGPLVNECT